MVAMRMNLGMWGRNQKPLTHHEHGEGYRPPHPCLSDSACSACWSFRWMAANKSKILHNQPPGTFWGASEDPASGHQHSCWSFSCLENNSSVRFTCILSQTNSKVSWDINYLPRPYKSCHSIMEDLYTQVSFLCLFVNSLILCSLHLTLAFLVPKTSDTKGAEPETQVWKITQQIINITAYWRTTHFLSWSWSLR